MYKKFEYARKEILDKDTLPFAAISAIALTMSVLILALVGGVLEGSKQHWIKRLQNLDQVVEVLRDQGHISIHSLESIRNRNIKNISYWFTDSQSIIAPNPDGYSSLEDIQAQEFIGHITDAQLPLINAIEANYIQVKPLQDITGNNVQVLVSHQKKDYPLYQKRCGFWKERYDEYGVIVSLELLHAAKYISQPTANALKYYPKQIRISGEVYSLTKEIAMGENKITRYFLLFFNKNQLIRVPIIAIVNWRTNNRYLATQNFYNIVNSFKKDWNHKLKFYAYTKIFIELEKNFSLKSIRKCIYNEKMLGKFKFQIQKNGKAFQLVTSYRYTDIEYLRNFVRKNCGNIRKIQLEHISLPIEKKSKGQMELEISLETRIHFGQSLTMLKKEIKKVFPNTTLRVIRSSMSKVLLFSPDSFENKESFLGYLQQYGNPYEVDGKVLIELSIRSRSISKLLTQFKPKIYSHAKFLMQHPSKNWQELEGRIPNGFSLSTPVDQKTTGNFDLKLDRQMTNAYVFANDTKKIPEVMNAIRKLHLKAFSEIEHILTLSENTQQMIITSSKVITLTFLFISTLIVGLSFYSIVHQKVGEIGILKNLGASKFTIFSIYYIESSIICTFSFSGIVFSYYIGSTLFFPYFQFTAYIVVNTIIISFFVTFISVLLPAILASRLDPIETIRKGYE